MNSFSNADCPCGVLPRTDASLQQRKCADLPFDCVIRAEGEPHKTCHFHWHVLRGASDEWDATYKTTSRTGPVLTHSGITHDALCALRDFLYKGCTANVTDGVELGVLLDEWLPMCRAYNIQAFATHIKHSVKMRIAADTFLLIARACVVQRHSPLTPIVVMPSVFDACRTFLNTHKTSLERHDNWIQERNMDSPLFHRLTGVREPNPHIVEDVALPPPRHMFTAHGGRPLYTSTPVSSLTGSVTRDDRSLATSTAYLELNDTQQLRRMSNYLPMAGARERPAEPEGILDATDISLSSAHGLIHRLVARPPPLPLPFARRRTSHVVPARLPLRPPPAESPPPPYSVVNDTSHVFARPIALPVAHRRAPVAAASTFSMPPKPSEVAPPRSTDADPPLPFDGDRAGDKRHCSAEQLLMRYPHESMPMAKWGEVHYREKPALVVTVNWMRGCRGIQDARAYERRITELARTLHFERCADKCWLIYCANVVDAERVKTAIDEEYRAKGADANAECCAIMTEKLTKRNVFKPGGHSKGMPRVDSRVNKLCQWTHADMPYMCVVDGAIARDDELTPMNRDRLAVGVAHFSPPGSVDVLKSRMAVYEVNGRQAEMHTIMALFADEHFHWLMHMSCATHTINVQTSNIFDYGRD